MKPTTPTPKNIITAIKDRIIFKKQLPQPKLIMCICCNTNPVDALDGYIICPDCIGKY